MGRGPTCDRTPRRSMSRARARRDQGARLPQRRQPPDAAGRASPRTCAAMGPLPSIRCTPRRPDLPNGCRRGADRSALGAGRHLSPAERFHEALPAPRHRGLLAEQRRDVPAQVRAAALRLQLHGTWSAAADGATGAEPRGTLRVARGPARRGDAPGARRVARSGRGDWCRRISRRFVASSGRLASAYPNCAGSRSWPARSRTGMAQSPRPHRAIGRSHQRHRVAQGACGSVFRQRAAEDVGRGVRRAVTAKAAPCSQGESVIRTTWPLAITSAYETQGRIETLVERVTASAPSAAANLRKSTGPSRACSICRVPPEGTLESLLNLVVTARSARAGPRLGQVPAPPRPVLDAICAALRTRPRMSADHSRRRLHELLLSPEQRQQAAARVGRAIRHL